MLLLQLIEHAVESAFLPSFIEQEQYDELVTNAVLVVDNMLSYNLPRIEREPLHSSKEHEKHSVWQASMLQQMHVQCIAAVDTAL